VRAIDVRHLGNDRVICCWQVGDVLIDPGPESSMGNLLAELGDERPRALLLTHIHLDHAGASGALVRRWPDLEVHVHEVGAPHMADPSKLLASASRLYGDDMERLWGEVVPVPEENLRILTGGELLDGFRVEHTPGHASHHVAYLHEESGQAFVGDVAGVRIPPASYVAPPTPPPDIDLDAWSRSLDVLRGWRPTALGLTHFGQVDEVEAHLDVLGERLSTWGERARTMDEPAFVERFRAEILDATDPRDARLYDQAIPAEQAWQGLERYWRKRSERG
jgi:glyoxylase-like metal-dependent hydrolase (beta-lactamase superfamily II)